VPAYAISEVEPRDLDLIERFRTLAEASIKRHGGRFLVRGGEVVPVEGGWEPRHVVIVEFPDMDRARQWYRSEDYAEALTVRDRALSRRLIFVEGVMPGGEDRKASRITADACQPNRAGR
jgi:uncharacterized protein (DUF1330 family)